MIVNWRLQDPPLGLSDTSVNPDVSSLDIHEEIIVSDVKPLRSARERHAPGQRNDYEVSFL
jgi:hypothetical protein